MDCKLKLRLSFMLGLPV